MSKPSKDSDAAHDKRLAGLVHADPKARFNLAKVDPGHKPFSVGDKAQDKAVVEELAQELDGLQNLFWADRRFKLLVVVQGMDACGKDGTLRHVFGRMTPLGVHAVSWRAPSEEERSHDFLWRIHQRAPAAGEIVLFNRSHYEDVLVPVVKRQLTGKQIAQRYAQINDFERMLTEHGTVILKYMLHISRDEQRLRLQDRLDDPAKHWKFLPEDLEVRKHWDAYQDAYADALSATGTPWAPWTVVPADSKTHRNLMIATLVARALKALNLRFPEGDPALRDVRVE
ncbi:PPK2 family polyphosphate kinase [Azohydromonas lata]|uniref:PPK2 family polyphosphate kinase n=1 Tax=Azohydromonas lata TaxID=45677 RepID=A0ABU5IEA8_9BURK|nr:PPK2 family polyphosphate kinase [Azohydromonas lata]MDZ5457456.1 PPK2 family polyphosphate kinase [Azohydromonas lata]